MVLIRCEGLKVAKHSARYLKCEYLCNVFFFYLYPNICTTVLLFCLASPNPSFFIFCHEQYPVLVYDVVQIPYLKTEVVRRKKK